MTSTPDLIRLGPAEAHHRLVLLHGWGADATDLLDLGELLVSPGVSVVALQAPLPHPAGVGRQWYDLQQPDWPELPSARLQLIERLQQLDAELPLQHTVLLGFSQGAALGLDVATRGDGLPLAGLIGCSGYPHPDWQPGRPAASAPLPILLTHGQQDPVVPYAASEELERRLQQAGHRVSLVGFSGGHTIDSGVLPILRAFVSQAWPD
jgi:phospholipase/carboxylesterase